jgi:hypothetical protein
MPLWCWKSRSIYIYVLHIYNNGLWECPSGMTQLSLHRPEEQNTRVRTVPGSIVYEGKHSNFVVDIDLTCIVCEVRKNKGICSHFFYCGQCLYLCRYLLFNTQACRLSQFYGSSVPEADAMPEGSFLNEFSRLQKNWHLRQCWIWLELRLRASWRLREF